MMMLQHRIESKTRALEGCRVQHVFDEAIQQVAAAAGQAEQSGYLLNVLSSLNADTLLHLNSEFGSGGGPRKKALILQQAMFSGLVQSLDKVCHTVSGLKDLLTDVCHYCLLATYKGPVPEATCISWRDAQRDLLATAHRRGVEHALAEWPVGGSQASTPRAAGSSTI